MSKVWFCTSSGSRRLPCGAPQHSFPGMASSTSRGSLLGRSLCRSPKVRRRSAGKVAGCSGAAPLGQARKGDRTRADDFVPFSYTPTRFGGRRQWLTCVKCGRHCRRIFGGRYFRCRQYHGLTYASQNETVAQRATDCADKIPNRLHDMCKSTNRARWELPPKPSRMRWRAYMRLRRQYDELRGRWVAGVMGRSGFGS